MLNNDVKGHLRFLARHVMRDETDWLVVKKQLLITLSPNDRSHFTRRDDKTKLHQPFNGFENAVRAYWHELTGNLLVLDEEKRLVKDNPEAYL